MEIVLDVKSATSCRAFIPFTPLPAEFEGKQVKLVLVESPDKEDDQ